MKNTCAWATPLLSYLGVVSSSLQYLLFCSYCFVFNFFISIGNPAILHSLVCRPQTSIILLCISGKLVVRLRRGNSYSSMLTQNCPAQYIVERCDRRAIYSALPPAGPISWCCVVFRKYQVYTIRVGNYLRINRQLMDTLLRNEIRLIYKQE